MLFVQIPPPTPSPMVFPTEVKIDSSARTDHGHIFVPSSRHDDNTLGHDEGLAKES